MRPAFLESLESRRLFSATDPVVLLTPHVETAAAATTISLAEGRFKGSSVSNKGFTTRLTINLGKERAGGTIIGTFDYLDGFDFVMHLRVSADNTFHGTIATGSSADTLAGTLTGVITTADHATIIDLSGRYTFSKSDGTGGDAGTFLVRN